MNLNFQNDRTRGQMQCKRAVKRAVKRAARSNICRYKIAKGQYIWHVRCDIIINANGQAKDENNIRFLSLRLQHYREIKISLPLFRRALITVSWYGILKGVPMAGTYAKVLKRQIVVPPPKLAL